jgi:hypothetical protein
MPVNLIVNGVGFNYPISGDQNWAESATGWAVAVTQNLTTINNTLSTISSGIFILANGSAAAPSLRFLSSPTTGIYRINTDVLGFTAGGTGVGQFDSTGSWAFGSNSSSAHSFTGTVLFNNQTTFNALLNGSSALFSGNVASNGTFQSANATAALPGFTFQNDLTSGLYLKGIGSLGLASNGIESAFIDSNGLFHFDNGTIFSSHSTTSDSVVLGNNDTIININSSLAPATVSLPVNGAGRFIVVKDTSGNASTNNIVISPLTGTIDGASSVTINTNYGSFMFFGDGTNWQAIGNSGASSGAVRTISTSTTLTSSDNIVLVTQSAPITITLPAVVKGKIIEIKDVNGVATTSNITVSAPGAIKIDGQTSTILVQNYQSIRIVGGTTNWHQL